MARALAPSRRLGEIKVPVLSIGHWGKMGLHLRGNILGFEEVKAPKKLVVTGAKNVHEAHHQFDQVEFHRKESAAVLRPAPQGQADRLSRASERRIRGTRLKSGAQSRHLAADGHALYALVSQRIAVRKCEVVERWRPVETPGAGGPSTTYAYPNPGWVSGVVGFGPAGPPGGFDPARRVLTFTTAPFESDLEIAGPVKLVLYASSTARDTDFFVKLSDQFPQTPDDRAKGLNPFTEIVTRGWLRASHRALDPARSTDMVPYHTHSDPQPLTPGEIYKFEISLEPTAYLIKQGHRLRLEIVNGDSPATEILWSHYYRPDKIGQDTICHDAAHQSELILPVSQFA